MAKTRMQGRKIPLLYTGSADMPECSLPADQVTIDGTLTLFADGDVVLAGRFFRGNRCLGLLRSDEINYAFIGGHAWRKRGSNTLVIRTRSPSGQQLVYQYGPAYQYGLIGLFQAAWYQVVPRLY